MNNIKTLRKYASIISTIGIITSIIMGVIFLILGIQTYNTYSMLEFEGEGSLNSLASVYIVLSIIVSVIGCAISILIKVLLNAFADLVSNSYELNSKVKVISKYIYGIDTNDSDNEASISNNNTDNKQSEN